MYVMVSDLLQFTIPDLLYVTAIDLPQVTHIDLLQVTAIDLLQLAGIKKNYENRAFSPLGRDADNHLKEIE
jgi:hypothetical protein